MNTYYVLDTNIWLDLNRRKLSCADITGREHVHVVVAPFVIMELMKETVKHKGKYFDNDKSVFECIAKCDVLELTKVFVFRRLWNSPEAAQARVRPENYKKLTELFIGSASYDAFIKGTKAPGCEWFQAENWGDVHEKELNKELAAINKLATLDPKSLASGIAKSYPFKDSLPKEDLIEGEFSAALEYLRSAMARAKSGANLSKNDRGMYVDFQLFFYLADPNAAIVSNEDFSNVISKSPQKTRIITRDQFLAL